MYYIQKICRQNNKIIDVIFTNVYINKIMIAAYNMRFVDFNLFSLPKFYDLYTNMFVCLCRHISV